MKYFFLQLLWFSALPASVNHWAFLPLQENPEATIDTLVETKLNAKKLTFSQLEKPERLLRRVYLDLIGLPPSPEEVAKWTANPKDEHFTNIVDDLLSRPQY